MIGENLGQFRILEKLGSGAMGVVYRARDGRLHRDVALKLLPPGTLQDDSIRRSFHHEALALSRLNHPGIATVHEFQSADGRDFLVMEYIAGDSLDRRIARGPLPEAEVIELGLQFAEALAEAHRQGVIHRDLKPANLRVTPEGRLKILDFGLARWESESVLGWGGRESRGLSGTLAYMAPELLSGVQPGEMTDLYSAGLVLYEAATGSQPFPGLGAGPLLEAIRTRTPPAPRSVNPAISPGLEDVILRCLERQPEHRFGSAADLAVALRRLQANPAARLGPSPAARSRALRGAAGGVALAAAIGAFVWWRAHGVTPSDAGEIRSMAVLPFGNLSGDPGQEYVADGMTDELNTQLSRVPGIRVISPSSVTRYKSSRPSMPEIARELSVDGVIEGNVRKENERLRATVHLVDARRNNLIWSDEYDGEATDILGLQSQVAQDIVRRIQVHLSQKDRARLAGPGRVDPSAYQFYTRGRSEWKRRSEDGIRPAIEYFQRAITADSTYAQAYAGLADGWAAAGLYGLIPPQDARPRALAAASRAVALDPELSEAHTSLGSVLHNFDWKWDDADREYARAILLNPNNSTPHLWRAHLMVQRARLGEAEDELSKARQLDPFSLTTALAEGVFAYYSRRYDLALERLRRAAEIDSLNPLVHRTTAGVLDRLGRDREAMLELIRERELQNEPGEAGALRAAYKTSGVHGVLELLIAGMIAKRETGAYQPAEHIAELYARLGRPDDAFFWLETAYREHDTELNRLRIDPIFDRLRSDPRFTSLLHRVGLDTPATSS